VLYRIPLITVITAACRWDANNPLHCIDPIASLEWFRKTKDYLIACSTVITAINVNILITLYVYDICTLPFNLLIKMQILDHRVWTEIKTLKILIWCFIGYQVASTWPNGTYTIGRAYTASTWCNIFIKIHSITRYTIDMMTKEYNRFYDYDITSTECYKGFPV
jgi:hypothetical protein